MACATNFASQLRYSGWPHKTVPLANLCHCAYRDERNIGASASDLFPQKCASDGSTMVALMAVVALFFHVKHNITANQ